MSFLRVAVNQTVEGPPQATDANARLCPPRCARRPLTLAQIRRHKKNASRLVNTSRKESLFETNPACIAGVPSLKLTVGSPLPVSAVTESSAGPKPENIGEVSAVLHLKELVR